MYRYATKKPKAILRLALLICFVSTTNIVAAQNNYEIRKIKFQGNKTFEKSELLTNLSIRESNFFTRVVQRKEASLYNDELIDADIERIKRFYQSEGFLSVEVGIDTLVVNEKKQTVDVFFLINENPPVTVNSVFVKLGDKEPVLSSDTSVRRIARRLSLRPSNRFTDNELYSDVSVINDRFMNRGHIYVNTTFDLNLQADSNKVDLLYTIKPGPVTNFGGTTITGNKYVGEKVIRRQLRYKEGDVFNKKKLEDTRKQMYNLQLFRVVSLTPQSNKETLLDPVPVQVYIQEMPRWSTRFGLGYGTEDLFRTFGEFTYRGIGGGTSRATLYVKHSNLTPYYVSLSWIEPQLLGSKLSVSVNPYAKQENEPGYNTQNYGINFPFSYPFGEYMRTSFTYYIEKVTQNVESNDADVPNPESNEFLYNKSGIYGSFTFNNAQPVISPVRGWLVSVGAKVNGYFFGSDFNYTRFWTDVRHYSKINRFSLASRAMIGTINSSDTEGFIPVEDRWYSGGSNSNRGWSRSAIGPKRESGTPLGGKSILELNFEVRHPLFWEVELATFVDASNVWEQSLHYDLKEMNIAVGGGLRVNTPIGPIRFDVGVPVWNEKRSVQFFLSVGQAF